MTFGRQIYLSYSIVLGLVVLSLSLNLNRLLVMTTSHHQIEEEWKEVSHIVEFQTLIDDFSDAVRQSASKGDRNTETLTRKREAMREKLKIIRSDLSPLEFEEEGHAAHEKKDFLQIQEAFGNLEGLLQNGGPAGGANVQPISRRMTEQLRKMKDGAEEFKLFNLEEMKRAIARAERVRRQAIGRSIGGAVLIVFFIGTISAWFAFRLRRHSEEAIRKEKTLTIGLLAQSLAHEMRNPLGIIKSAVSVISNKLPPGCEQRELAGDLIEEVERIDGLLDEMLTVNTRRPPKIAVEPISPLIDQVMVLLKSRCDKAGVRIRYDDQTACALCPHDRDQVKQMLLNLFLNAIQASSGGGIIDVTTKLLNDTYYLLVQDYGRGVKKKDLKKIFDPFYSTTENGLGLGLAVVKKIVESHKGTIEVFSESNRGTLFSVALPGRL